MDGGSDGCYSWHLIANLLITEEIMMRMKLGTNFTVFLLFFGVGVLEAFQTRNWVKVAFWLAIGSVFLMADNLKKGV